MHIQHLGQICGTYRIPRLIVGAENIVQRFHILHISLILFQQKRRPLFPLFCPECSMEQPVLLMKQFIDFWRTHLKEHGIQFSRLFFVNCILNVLIRNFLFLRIFLTDRMHKRIGRIIVPPVCQGDGNRIPLLRRRTLFQNSFFQDVIGSLIIVL